MTVSVMNQTILKIASLMERIAACNHQFVTIALALGAFVTLLMKLIARKVSLFLNRNPINLMRSPQRVWHISVNIFLYSNQY